MRKNIHWLLQSVLFLAAAALWCLLDESMLLMTAADPAAARAPAAGETVEFVFPWLESLLRCLHL